MLAAAATVWGVLLCIKGGVTPRIYSRFLHVSISQHPAFYRWPALNGFCRLWFLNWPKYLHFRIYLLAVFQNTHRSKRGNRRYHTSPMLCNRTILFAADRPQCLHPESFRILFALAWHTEDPVCCMKLLAIEWSLLQRIQNACKIQTIRIQNAMPAH